MAAPRHPHDSPTGPRRRCRCLVHLGLCLLLGVGPALAADSIAVGLGAYTRLDYRYLLFQSQRMNVAGDSLWMWDAAARSNIAKGLLARGGRVTVIDADSAMGYHLPAALPGGTAYFGEGPARVPFPVAARLVDGRGETAYRPDDLGLPRGTVVVLDLGGVFGVDRVRLYPRLDDDHRHTFPQVFTVSTGETTNAATFQRLQPLAFTTRLPNPAPVVDASFRPRSARYVRLDVAGTRDWELAEVEVYADGTVAEGQYTSDAIVADSRHPVWGRVRTEAGPITDVPVVLQTATGPTAAHTLYYRFTGMDGHYSLVSKQDWERLEEEEQGPVARNSRWSAFQTLRRAVVLSPGRQYLQFRVILSEPGVVIRRLIFEYARVPLVLRLAAEINPATVPAGVDTTFTLSLLANTRDDVEGEIDARGFRRVHVLTTALVSQVTAVTVRDRPVPYGVVTEPGRGFSVHLGPRVELDATMVEITFRGAVHADGTRFDVQAEDVLLSDGRLDTIYQVAEAGDVEPRTPGGVLAVRFDPGAGRPPLLSPLRVTPPVVTPNGDGRNDAARVSYDLVRLGTPAPVRITVHDLAGRPVRALFTGTAGAGRQGVDWDGRDDGGRRVPAGIYLCRVEVGADEGTAVRQAVIAVAY